MTLHVRLARIDDLPRVHELMVGAGRGTHDAPTLARMPELWRDLLNARRLEMHVFVDDTLPNAERVLGVASGVWVSDAFADALLAVGEPGEARQIVAGELQGQSVILTRAEAAAANGRGGVNGVGLDFAFAHGDWSVPRALRWAPLLFESGRIWLDGWRLRMALRECIGRDVFLMTRGSGMSLFHRQTIGHFTQGGHRLPPLERRYLMGMTREKSRRLPAAMATMLFFTNRTPRFRFTIAEQDLLLLAVRNHADDECAAELHLSPHTIKMRWRAIFDRVAEQRPDWFPSSEATEGQRGVEKRRHLLAYLARHMEEIRPRSSASGTGEASGPSD